MTSFSRFQNRNGKARKDVQAKVNTHFIFKGYPSIELTRGENAFQAVVVNKQEQEEAYIYTQLADELNIGDICKVKNLNLLVDQEITIIKDVDWHKYHSLLCNLEFNGWHGYFRGPEKTHININLHKDVLLTSAQKPLLILAGKPLKFQDKIMINDRAWIVDEYDSISTQGITYYSLMPTTMSKEIIEANQDKKVFLENYIEPEWKITPSEVDDNVIKISNYQQTISIQTENGYFKTNSNSLNILKHTNTEICFTIPFGINNFTIERKENGNSIIENYQVVE